MRGFVRVACGVVALALSACSFDLAVPDKPQRGGVTGKLDLQGHAPNGAHSVVLVAEDNTKNTQNSSDDGSFTFGDLAPGVYYLDVNVAGFEHLIRPSVRVLSGQVYDVGVLAPLWLQSTPKAGSVVGKVTVEGGAGEVTGAQVEFVLEALNQTVALAAVTSTGQFVQQLAPGSYTLRASHPLFVTKVLTSVTVAEAAQTDLSAQPLLLAVNPAVVTGQVLKEVDTQDPVPAVGALVTFEGNGVTTTTDVTGHYQLGGLPGGPSSLRFTLSGFHDVVTSRAVTLKPGETSAVGAVTLALDRGDLVGDVRTADGQPIQDATVSIPGTTYATQVVQDASNASKGSFVLHNLPVGQYSVRAAKARYIAAVSANVTVLADATARLSAPLTLAIQQGDFDIDDNDPTNAPGYSRTTAVTLHFNFTGAVTFRASEDPAFAGVAFSPYTGANQPFTLSSTQGTHVIYAQFEDNSSNVSPTFSAPVVLDSVAPSAPSIAINSAAGFTKQANPLALTLLASDAPGPGVDTVSGLGFVRISDSAPTDAGTLTSPAIAYLRDVPFVPSSLTDGPKTVWAQFIDNAGNQSAVVSASIVVDSVVPQAPSISIARGPRASADGYTDTALVQLTLGAATEPNGGYVLFRLANSTAALARATFTPFQQDVAWFLDPSLDGSKTVYAEFIDAAGNAAPVQNATTYYDTTPPSPVSVATVGGFDVTNDAGVALVVSAVDVGGLSATSALTLSEDPSFQGGNVGPQAMPPGGTISFGLKPGEGARRIFARFRDLAGNDATASVALTYDSVAPTGTVDVTGALADGTPSTVRTATTSVTANVTANDAQGYLLGADSLAACPTSAASYIALPPSTSALAATLDATAGPRAVKLCLRDSAGNIGGPFTDTIVLDSSAPSGCTLSLSGKMADGVTAAPAGRTAKSQVTATVSGCSTDVVEYFVANGATTCSASVIGNWSAYAAPSTAQGVLLAQGEGTNTVSGCYRDAARNVAAFTAANIDLDSTAPSALGITLNDGALYLGQAQLDGGQPIVKVTGSSVGATSWAVSETNPSSFGALQAAPNNLFYLPLGGAGLRTVYARFSDDLGNLSSVVSGTITVDTTPPSTMAAAFRIATADGGTYINTTSVTLATVPPADAVQAQFVERAASGPCAVGDYASVGTSPAALNYVFTLSGGDGQKRVCIRWFDAAGNPSSSLVDTKTLDTTPPSQPFLLAADRVFNPNTTGEAAGSWVSIVNTVDPQHLDWQVLGGQATQWQSTPALPPGAGTPGCTTGLCLRALLNVSGSVETGTPNTIRFREVDSAGNVSGEGVVVLTTDIVPPRSVALSSFWVDNRSTTAVLRWQLNDGGSPDTVNHAVYYGAAPGNPGDGGTAPPTGYFGTAAAEGSSPILVGSGNQVTLSSLANGSLAYVTVRAIDRAGNLSASATGTPEVVLQPNEVSPTHIATVGLMADSGVASSIYESSIDVVGDLAYVYAGSTTGVSVVQPVGLATLASPLQGGVVGVGSPPVMYAPVKSADGLSSFPARAGAMATEPPYLFTAAGNHFRIWSILNPTAPVPLYDLDLATVVSGTTDLNAIEVRGTNAFAVGYNGGSETFFNIDLTSLYDNNSSTFPTTANAVGFGTGQAVITQAILWSRDRLAFGNVFGQVSAWDLTNALDGSGATNMSIAGRFGLGLGWRMNHWRGVASGNIAFISEPSALRLLDITQLWTKTSPYYVEVSRTALNAQGQYQVVADQAFMSESNYSGLQTANVSDLNFPRDTGAVRPNAASYVSTTGLALYGNYAVQATEAGSSAASLRAYEIASPRAMHRVFNVGLAAGRSNIEPGFVVSATGMVTDMLNGGVRVVTPTVAENCVLDGVVVDDTLVTSMFDAVAVNGKLRITRLDDYHGRIAAPGTITANSATYFSPTTGRWSGVERYGNYLVVTSARPTGSSPPTALWVEVYRLNNLRSRATGAARTLSSVERVGQFQYDTSPNSWQFFNSRIRMTGPYAVITSSNASLTNPHTYLLDLRPLLDDNAATSMSATNIIGRMGIRTGDVFSTAARDGVLKGDKVYVAATGPAGTGLYVYNAADAFDGNAGTVLDGDDLMTVKTQSGAYSVDVAGAYAVVTGATSAATISAYDISDPANPVLMSEVPYTGQTIAGSCYTDMGIWTQIVGGRAYIGSFERFDVVDLE